MTRPMEPPRHGVRLQIVTTGELEMAGDVVYATTETFESFYGRCWDPVYRAVVSKTSSCCAGSTTHVIVHQGQYTIYRHPDHGRIRFRRPPSRAP